MKILSKSKLLQEGAGNFSKITEIPLILHCNFLAIKHIFHTLNFNLATRHLRCHSNGGGGYSSRETRRGWVMTALHRALKTCRSVGRGEGGVRAQGLGRPAALGMGSQAEEVGDGPDG